MDRRMGLRERAAAHVKDMEERFGEKIKSSIEHSIIYGGSGKAPQKSGENRDTEYIVLNVDSTDAVLQYPNCALLNFASYRHAGGGFITGAWGCGVFGQDPAAVARLFAERLEESSVKLAVFAIPGDTRKRNYAEFEKRFS